MRCGAFPTLWIGTIASEDDMHIGFGSVEVPNGVPTERKPDLGRETVCSKTGGDSFGETAYRHFIRSVTEPPDRFGSISGCIVASQERVPGFDSKSVGKHCAGSIVPCVKMIMDLEVRWNSCESTTSCMKMQCRKPVIAVVHLCTHIVARQYLCCSIIPTGLELISAVDFMEMIA